MDSRAAAVRGCAENTFRAGRTYVACCGTSIQPVLERLRQNPKLDTVYLCLDNDDAGNDASDRMMDTLEDMGLEVQRLCPVRKDWNDDLRAKFERKEN